MSKAKQGTSPAPEPTWEEVVQRQFVTRVKQAVIDAGSVTRAERALRMTAAEIQAVLDANK